jgi:hypothetical protein
MPETVLTALERRVLGNLAIPRNVDNIVEHIRSTTPATGEQVDALLTGVLSDHRWVVKLGEHDDPATLASKAQAHKQTIEMADEQAQILSRRLLHPERQYRARGVQWMLSNDGLAQLHAPPPDTPPPMTPAQVQAAVDAEWARVLKGHDATSYNAKWGGEDKPDGPSLASALLEDEFLRWYDIVATDCEKRWNVRPRAPMAGGASGYSDLYENSSLDAENQKTNLPAVIDPWFMALSILAFNDTDTGTTADNGSHIPTYTGYARKSVAGTDMPAGSGTGGSTANTSAITFAACTASTSTILAVANCSTSTVGLLRKWGDQASTVISTTQTPAQFAIGAYVTTLA